jgi:leucyl aminopeptidase (aminopeptidase T)
MADLQRMIESARRAMVHVLELVPTDRVLVVRDPQCRTCSEAFFEAARAHGCWTTSYLLPEQGRPLSSLPDGMADALDDVDVVINAMSGSSDEVPFRIEWLTLLEERGLRVGHSPNIHADMMDGGPMDVDYGLMADRADRIIDALSGARSVRMTAPAGSDLVVDITDRRFVTDVRITDTERGCNLPCGEVYCAPVEDGANGLVVADGSIGGEGPPPSPVTLHVEAGRVTAVGCADPAWESRVEEFLDIDEGARVIAELGIGLNPKARLVGIMLEDEKAHRTAHIAFGSNIGMPGGVNESATHIDYLVHCPTIVAGFDDDVERTILDNGDLCI